MQDETKIEPFKVGQRVKFVKPDPVHGWLGLNSANCGTEFKILKVCHPPEGLAYLVRGRHFKSAREFEPIILHTMLKEVKDG